MDWFTWLSKTSLDPSLVYDYAVTFTYNELEEDDILYFDHEFLQSMDVSVAKHRLEILKLARKAKGGREIHPTLWFKFAIKKTKKYVFKKVEALIHRNDSSLSLIPVRNNSLRWKVSMLQRNKRCLNLRARMEETRPTCTRNESHGLGCGEKNLMIGYKDLQETGCESSSSIPTPSSTIETKVNTWNSSFSSTLGQSIDGEYWSGSMDENKWDSMFTDLKPT